MSRSRFILLLFMFISTSDSVWSEPPRRIEVYAHRGARAFAPENTMGAYMTALRIGADWIDMDVVLTKDHEVLLSHNLVLNPDITRDEHGEFLAPSLEALNDFQPDARNAYNRKYAVRNLTLKELRRFDVGRLNPASAYSRLFPNQVAADGIRMPTLRDVVRFADKATRKMIRYQVEMKTDPAHPDYSPSPETFAEAVYKVLRDAEIIDRVEVQSFDFRCLYELQKIDRRIRTAYLTSRDNEKGGEESFHSPDPKVAGLWTGGKLLKDYGGSMPSMVKALGGFAWDPEDAELTKEALDEAHRLGLKVVVWSWSEKQGTAFDAQLVAKMIDWGVDGIITDDPGRLISMLAARGLPVPARY